MSRRLRLRPHWIMAHALALLASAALVVVAAGPASAHDPIILTEQQRTAEKGPLLMDGTVSFAVYGAINGVEDTRGFRVRFAAGDTFVLSALVPDLAPERSLARRDLPNVRIRTPGGQELPLAPGAVTTFAEPFTKTNYRRYLEWSAPAEAGDYEVVISGSVPARFTVSIGEQERFGTEVQGAPNRNVGVAGVQQWYETSPSSLPAVASSTTSPPGPTTATAETAAGPRASEDGSGASIGWIALAVGLIATAGATLWSRRRGRRIARPSAAD